MSYAITIDEIHAIVELSFFDVTEPNDHLKARDELLEICHTRGIKKILVNAENLKIVEVSPLSLFDFGSTWAELARGTDIHFAAIFPKEPKTKEDVRFVDDVAYNRGFISRSFEDIVEARKWLQNT